MRIVTQHGTPPGLFCKPGDSMEVTGWWTAVIPQDTQDAIVDKHYALVCPHCGALSNLTAVSTPRWAQMRRYQPKQIIIGFRCDACNSPVALRFEVQGDYDRNRALFSHEYEELERPMETFDYQYLPSDVASDFREALTCYSNSCFNATGAMCRRTIQSVATDLGATGSTRVEKQILEAKDTAGMDDETFVSLNQIMLTGHDGAHPHLPPVNKSRAAVLVEIMKDVLYQLYIRKAKVQEALKLRQDAIASKKPAAS
jgi:hypothetical protein